MVQWSRRSDLIAIIDAHITTNKSAAEAARAINRLCPGLGVTRNAVIGQAFRCGKRFKAGANANTTRKRPVLKRAGPRPAYFIAEPIKVVPLPHSFEEREALDMTIPVEQRKGIFELEDNDCRWPVGDPCKPEFFFCAAPIQNGSYCDHHAQRARNAPKPVI